MEGVLGGGGGDDAARVEVLFHQLCVQAQVVGEAPRHAEQLLPRGNKNKTFLTKKKENILLYFIRALTQWEGIEPSR